MVISRMSLARLFIMGPFTFISQQRWQFQRLDFAGTSSFGNTLVQGWPELAVQTGFGLPSLENARASGGGTASASLRYYLAELHQWDDSHR